MYKNNASCFVIHCYGKGFINNVALIAVVCYRRKNMKGSAVLVRKVQVYQMHNSVQLYLTNYR